MADLKNFKHLTVTIGLILMIFLSFISCQQQESIDINSQLSELLGIKKTQKITSQNAQGLLKITFYPPSLKMNIEDEKYFQITLKKEMDYLPESAMLFISQFDSNILELLPNDFEFGKYFDLGVLQNLEYGKTFTVEVISHQKLNSVIYFYLFYKVDHKFNMIFKRLVSSGEVDLDFEKFRMPIIIDSVKERVSVFKDHETIVLEMVLKNNGEGNIFDYNKMNEEFKGYASLDELDFNIVNVSIVYDGNTYYCEVGDFIGDYVKVLCEFDVEKPNQNLEDIVDVNLKYAYVNIFPYSIEIS